LSERVKNFFGMQEPPSQTQQLASDIRSTLEMPESASGFFSGMKSSLLRASSGFSAAVGIEEIQPGDASMMREIEEATTLSYRQRFNAFFVCLGLGIVCSGLSFLFYFNTTVFAMFYTIGNFLSLSSSAFFWGPKAYFKMMFKKGRWMSTLAMLFMMFLTLFVVIVTGSGILTFICISLQSCALFWYTISYIPLAQKCVKGIATRCFGGFAEEVTEGW